MALTRLAQYDDGTVASGTDIEAEFDQLYNNPIDLWSPAAKAADMNGFELILDADADTSITADTDDRIDFRLSATDLFRFIGTAVSPVNGFDFTAAAAGSEPSIAAVGSDADINITLSPKGAGTIDLNGNLSGTGIATQAQMETGTATNVAVTPGRTQNHPGVIKGWGDFGSDGTIAASYNVTSIADTGVGRVTVTWGTDFSSADYVVVGTAQTNTAGGTTGYVIVRNDVAPAAGTTEFDCISTTETLIDPNEWHVLAVGDQ